MIQDASHTYTYDAENRLTQVDSGVTASYVYDALGRRSRRTAGSYLADYLYNTQGLVDTVLENTHITRSYIYVNGQLQVIYANGTTYFVHADHLGSVIALLAGLFAIFANMLSFIMIGKINERVHQSERISYFWWGTEVRKRYKLLYPAGKLATLADLCLILMVLCFMLLIKFWVFGNSSDGRAGGAAFIFFC